LIKLQNLQKFLSWTRKLDEDRKVETGDNYKLNKTIMHNYYANDKRGMREKNDR